MHYKLQLAVTQLMPQTIYINETTYYQHRDMFESNSLTYAQNRELIINLKSAPE